MVTYRWNNEIQRVIVEEWTEGCQKARGLQDLRNLRKAIAQKYDLNMSIVQGIVEQGATEGIVQRSYPYGKKYEAVNLHELMSDFEQRLENVERKLNFAIDGIQNVLEAGETMAIHLHHLKKMGKWMKKRGSLDMQEIGSITPDRTKAPPLLEAEFTEPQNATTAVSASGNRGAIEVDKEIEEDEIKTEPLTTDRTKEIEKLRRQIDKARARMDSRKAEKPPPRLLFSGIEEGKKALPH